MFLEWDEKYSVKSERMDEQHKILLHMINGAVEAANKKEGIRALADALDSIVLYARVHFLSEEKYMRGYNYPDLDAHRNEHACFLKHIEEFKKDLKSEKDGLMASITRFLKNWLIFHILVEDMKYSAFING